MSKYVAMMRKQVSYKEHYANKSEVPAAAEIYRSEAADWRAMREAWEAMVNVCDLVSYGVYSEPENCITEAKAALAKARGE